jgi:hypothetical protein
MVFPSRVSATSYRSHRKFRRNTEGEVSSTYGQYDLCGFPKAAVRCAFFDRTLHPRTHPRIPLILTLAGVWPMDFLSGVPVCTGSHCKFASKHCERYVVPDPMVAHHELRHHTDDVTQPLKAMWYRTQWLLQIKDGPDKTFATNNSYEVHLVESWEPPSAYSPDPNTNSSSVRWIHAYTNADAVELLVNGKSQGTRSVIPMIQGPGSYAEWVVRCAFTDRKLHSRMPLDPTHVRLKVLHACDQWHSSRESTALTGWHCKFRPRTVGSPMANRQPDSSRTQHQG